MSVALKSARNASAHVTRNAQRRGNLGGLAATTIILAAIILASELLPYLGFRTRSLVALIGLAFATGLIRARRVLGEHARDWRLYVLFAISVGAVVVVGLSRGRVEPYQLFVALTPVLVGWCILVWLLPDFSQRETDGSPRTVEGERIPHRHLLLLVGGSFALFAAVHYVAVSNYVLIPDEASYLLQSSWLRFPHFSLPVDPAFADFFKVRFTAYDAGRIYTQYPPGYPVVLAAFRLIGLEWWSTPILATSSIYLCAQLGQRLAGARAGLIAALLLAVHPWFLVVNAGYVSQSITIPCVLGAALLLIDAESAATRRRFLLCFSAGGLLGILFAARPLTALAMGVTLAAWAVLRRTTPVSRTLGMLAFVALGGLLPFTLTLVYNWRTTGAALTFGYDVVDQGLHGLGFGKRGHLNYAADLKRVPYTTLFTPVDGVVHFIRFFATAFSGWIGLGLLLPGAYISITHGFRFSWRYLLPFLVLPLIYSFYWSDSPRFMSELLPFALLGASAAFSVTLKANSHLTRALLALVLLSSVVLSTPWHSARQIVPAPWLREPYFHDRSMLRTFERVDALQKEHGKLLLFVNDGADSWAAVTSAPALGRLYLYNRTPDGPVVTVRDRGAANAKMIRQYQDRTPIRIVWPDNRTQEPANRTQEPTIELISPTP